MNNKMLFALVGTLAFVAQPAFAKEFIVEMKNAGDKTMVSVKPVFVPDYVDAKVGDTVRFVPTDKGHNAAPIAGMVPDGLTLADGAISKEYVLKLTKPGLYGIKCTPHFGMGMVALVKAGPGKPANAATAAAAAEKIPPLAKRLMLPLLARTN